MLLFGSRKEPWFRNRVCNGHGSPAWFAVQVAISKSRFLSVLLPQRRD